MRKLFYCCMALAALLLGGLLGGKMTIHAQPEPAPAGDPRAVAAATNDFAFRLYAELNSEAQDKNLFISPLSLAQALSMTYNGAAGATKAGMAKTLGGQGMELEAWNGGQAALLQMMEKSDPKVETAIANALFAQQGYGFRDDFLQRNKTFYRALVKTTDVTSDAGVKEINAWVSQQTREKITDLLKPGDLNALTRLVLVNAVYFKGAWSLPFDKAITREGDFTPANGATKKLPMMRISDDFRYYAEKDFQAVSLPYGQGRISMYLVLPAKGTSLQAFSTRLTSANWQQWMGKFAQTKCTITLPRFKATYETAMNKPLAKLGMAEAFDDRLADFSGMTGRPDLHIDLVRHKATLEVNEEGAEAAAATGVVMGLRSLPLITEITIDRPFFCAIRDNDTGALLFLGNIVNPE